MIRNRRGWREVCEILKVNVPPNQISSAASIMRNNYGKWLVGFELELAKREGQEPYVEGAAQQILAAGSDEEQDEEGEEEEEEAEEPAPMDVDA